MTQQSSLVGTIAVAATCTAIVTAILLSLRARGDSDRPWAARTSTGPGGTGPGGQTALLRALVAQSPSALYVKDLNGRFLFVNDAFLTTYGVTEAGVLGQTDDYLNPTLAAIRQANDRRAHAGPIHLEETAEVDGETRTYESQKFPLYDAAGQLYAVCGTSLDVTDRRRAARDADRANADIVARAQATTEHLTTMSQAIRAPMKGVLALSTRLMGTHLDLTQRRYAIAIHSAGNALLGVINNGLDHALKADTVEPTSARTPSGASHDPGADRLRSAAGDSGPSAGNSGADAGRDVSADAGFGAAGVGISGGGDGGAGVGHLSAPIGTGGAEAGHGSDLGGLTCAEIDGTEGALPNLRLRAAAGPGPTAWPSPDGPSTAGLRILVVGTGADRPALEDDLRRWHLVVTSTHTADAALTALRAAAIHGQPFDVLLLDADPGDIDTTELPSLVIAAPDIPDIRTVILNRTATPGDATSNCLAKPVHRSALYEVLAQTRPAHALPVTPAPGAFTRPHTTRAHSPAPHRNGSW